MVFKVIDFDMFNVIIVVVMNLDLVFCLELNLNEYIKGVKVVVYIVVIFLFFFGNVVVVCVV